MNIKNDYDAPRPEVYADSDFHGAVRRQVSAATHGRYFHGRVYLGRRVGLDLRMRPCAPGFGVGEWGSLTGPSVALAT